MGTPRLALHLNGAAYRVEALRLLRSNWQTASLTAGWAFPDDWALVEVDEVCAAFLDVKPNGVGADRAKARDALLAFGRARAQTGAELDETLRDLAALCMALDSLTPSVLECEASADPDSVPAWMLRATALGWSEVLSASLGDIAVADALTGLVTPAYLRTRLAEVYQGEAQNSYTLVIVSVDMSTLDRWSRSIVMILVAEVLRESFASGQTITLLGPSVAAVLTRCDIRMVTQRARVRWMLAKRLGFDPAFAKVRVPEPWFEALPPTYEEAKALLTRLSREGRRHDGRHG